MINANFNLITPYHYQMTLQLDVFEEQMICLIKTYRKTMAFFICILRLANIYIANVSLKGQNDWCIINSPVNLA